MSSQATRDSANSNTSNATTNSATTQRKILEDLQLKKQLFLKQGVSQALTPSTVTTSPTIGWQSGTDGHVTGGTITAATQRNNVIQTTSTSFGSFAITDSAFGNTLMPVLPRLEGQIKLQVDGFTSPKVEYEQYITPPHIAAHLLFHADQSYQDLEERRIADLGCGCGMLSIGATMFDPTSVTGFDIDEDALDICRTNIEDFELDFNIELKRMNVLNEDDMKPYHGKFDTVVLNPPFGTKNNKGADIKFLKVACALSCNVIYTLHKTSTSEFIKKKSREFGLEGGAIAKLRYDLPRTYKFHKKDSVDIEVDLYRFTKPKPKRK